MPSFEKRVNPHGDEQDDGAFETQANETLGEPFKEHFNSNSTSQDKASDPLGEAIAHYANTLTVFENAPLSPSQQDAIAVLMARDRILTLLATHDLSPPLSQQLIRLDSQLRANSITISRTLSLIDYIVALNPPQTAWWWYFDAPEEIHPWDRLDWLWSSLSIACFTASISLIADVSSRFLSGGPDTLGAFTISTQSILTLVTARSALTSTGQQAVRRLLERIRLPKYLWQEAGFVLAALLLLGMLGFYSSLPAIANYYRIWGDEVACIHDGFSTVDCSRNPLVAEQHYRRALKLDPHNLNVHFHLGQLYEQLNRLNEAHDQYQIAALTGATPETVESS
ncbi:MAG: hypothetical protein F6K09_35540, partial [Merismopedia sp. SIO2A8]|nr:hypothetical protein [Merismopedia sp. SIO2A8]